MVDELALTLAPVVVGGQGLRATSGAALRMPTSFQLHHVLHAEDGPLFTSYRRGSAPAPEIAGQS